MELSESETRRAVNLIWNAARDYTFEPDFKVFDENGRAELYWNCIVGAARRHYEWEKLSALFHTFRGMVEQTLYENLLWLGLENALYLREREERPALPALRESYAHRAVSMSRAAENDRLLDVLEEAHFRRALGETPQLKDRDRELLDALEYGADLDTEQILARTEELFGKYLGYQPQEPEEDAAERKKKASFVWFGSKRRDTRVHLPAVRGFGFGFGDHADEYGGTEASRRNRLTFQLPIFSSQTDQDLRKYIMNYFGTPLYDERQVLSLEQEFCTGNHRACHLHFTRGAYDDASLAIGYVGAQKRAILQQVAKNRAFYEANLAKNRNSIANLTNRIRNSILTHLESTSVKSSVGRLCGGRVWRGVYLNDSKIFEKELRGDSGNLSVDLLLDASTSQFNRQEMVATQGYIIAESLTRCGLPVRVYSFCSMSGYTVVNLLRDYQERGKNENIFNYFTTGCNRDGLAIRIAAGLLRKTDCEHKLLIILSDAKPNDVLKVEVGKNLFRDYTEEVGVEDTAAEVHRARMEGISVISVFTGNDSDLPAARKIYGRDFTRIRRVNQFADTVGALIQTQIKNL
jgi:hypothetical protein